MFTNFLCHQNLAYFSTAFAVIFILFLTDVQTKENNISYKVVISELNHPWSVAWLDDKLLIITKRNGNFILVENNKKITLGLPVTDIFCT